MGNERVQPEPNPESIFKGQVTQHEEIRLGQMAAAAQPFLSVMYNTIAQQHWAAFRNSPPENTKEREHIKLKDIVMENMRHITNAVINRGLAVEEQLAADNSVEQKHMDKLNAQGFEPTNEQQRGAS